VVAGRDEHLAGRVEELRAALASRQALAARGGPTGVGHD
jgi:hypothetical protein